MVLDSAAARGDRDASVGGTSRPRFWIRSSSARTLSVLAREWAVLTRQSLWGLRRVIGDAS